MDALSDVLSNIRLVSPLLARLRIGAGAAVAMDARPAGELAASFHYIERGNCDLICDDRSIALEQGDIVLLPRWPAYRLSCGDAMRAISIAEVASGRSSATWTLEDGIDTVLHLTAGDAPYNVDLLGGIFAFRSPTAALILKELPDLMHMKASHRTIAVPLSAAMDLVRYDGPTGPGHNAVAQRLLEALLIEILRQWSLDSKHRPGALRGMTDPALAPVLYAIHRQPGHRWTLQALAAIAGKSRSAFAAHFTAAVGMPPAAYVAEWRCRIAERRIVEGEPTATIAFDLGYESSFAFARMFQRMRGMTPKQYRSERWRRKSDAPPAGVMGL